MVGARRRAATLLFAAGTVTNLAVGRLAFALGLAAGLLAALAAQRGRWWLAAALSLATSLASPVAGCFLAIAWAAATIARRRRTGRLAPCCCAAATAAPIVVFAIAFPEGGTFPFRFPSLVVVLLTCALLLVAVPVRHYELRIGAAVYALVALGAFVVPTPLGGNVVRLGMFLTAPILVAVGAWSRRYLVLAALPLLLWWQWSPAIDGVARAARDPVDRRGLLHAAGRLPAAAAAAGEPDRDRLHAAPLRGGLRCAAVPLARGWERQLDMLDNPQFYEGRLDATTYHRWLVSNGVELVALPDAPLDPSAAAEAAIIAGAPSYLQPAWHDAHWRVWRVVGSSGLTSAGAELVARRGDEMTFDAHAPGPVLVRVRWTRFWSLDRPRLRRAGDRRLDEDRRPVAGDVHAPAGGPRRAPSLRRRRLCPHRLDGQRAGPASPHPGSAVSASQVGGVAPRRGERLRVTLIWSAPRRERPLKTGARFSRKARGPSVASFDDMTACRGLLDAEGLGLGHRLGLAEGGEDALDRERAVAGDALGDLPRLGERLAVGHDVVDEAELVGPLGGEVARR